jgi:hypothetical protein
MIRSDGGCRGAAWLAAATASVVPLVLPTASGSGVEKHAALIRPKGFWAGSITKTLEISSPTRTLKETVTLTFAATGKQEGPSDWETPFSWSASLDEQQFIRANCTEVKHGEGSGGPVGGPRQGVWGFIHSVPEWGVFTANHTYTSGEPPSIAVTSSGCGSPPRTDDRRISTLASIVPAGCTDGGAACTWSDDFKTVSGSQSVQYEVGKELTTYTSSLKFTCACVIGKLPVDLTATRKPPKSTLPWKGSFEIAASGRRAGTGTTDGDDSFELHLRAVFPGRMLKSSKTERVGTLTWSFEGGYDVGTNNECRWSGSGKYPALIQIYRTGGVEGDPVGLAFVASIGHPAGLPVAMGTVTEVCTDGTRTQTVKKYAYAILPIVSGPNIRVPLKTRALSRTFRSRVRWGDFPQQNVKGKIVFSSK